MPSRAPNWVYPGAKIDLDFRNRRWYGGYVSEKKTSQHFGDTFSDGGGYAASNPFTPQRSGILLQGGITQNRITDLGLFAERASTNSCLWCRDLTNAVWTATTMTTAKTQVGADGVANSASIITATAPLATVVQSITKASAANIFSAWVKRVTGTGTVTIYCDAGVTPFDITSLINTSTYTWVQIPVQTITNPTVGFTINTSGDAIAVDFCQCESAATTGMMATTPLLTTTTTISRGNQTCYAQSANVTGTSANHGSELVKGIFSSGGDWTFIMSFNGDCTNSAGTGPGLVVTDLTVPSDISGGGGSILKGSANPGNNGRGNWNKAAVRCDGSGTKASLNGQPLGAGDANKPNVNASGTHFNIGNNGSGTANHPLCGSIGRFTMFNYGIPDGLLIEYASLTNPYDPYP